MIALARVADGQRQRFYSSIPDRVFKEAGRFAREHGRSRSELYSDAVRQYLVRHAPDSATEAMNKACEAVETQGRWFRPGRGAPGAEAADVVDGVWAARVH